jgi:hypothetical protein
MNRTIRNVSGSQAESILRYVCHYSTKLIKNPRLAPTYRIKKRNILKIVRRLRHASSMHIYIMAF